MKFAPGTPESVMRDREEKFYGNKNKRNETTPPLKITAEMREKAAASNLEKQEMAAREAAMAAVAERERTARPITGVAGPEMPTFGTPSISPVEKAKQAADLAAKIKANTPLPAPPSRTANRPFFQNQRPPVQPPMQPRPPVPPPMIGGQNTNSPTSPSIGRLPTTPDPKKVPDMPSQDPRFAGPAITPQAMKKGGKVKSSSYKSGGNVSSASKRGDGIAQRGKTKGRMC